MNKQDKEKAKELASKYQFTDGSYIDSITQIYDAITEMAEWKEQQMIEKAIAWLEPTFKSLAGYYSGAELVDDFKQFMKEE